MPETRYVKEFKDGVLVNQVPYEVSDEQLADEKARRDIDELMNLADSDITVPKVGKYMKALARLRR